MTPNDSEREARTDGRENVQTAIEMPIIVPEGRHTPKQAHTVHSAAAVAAPGLPTFIPLSVAHKARTKAA